MNSSDDGFIKITKMEAAERQLITAVKLYFRHEDPFSIHTLAGAAVGILDDLAGLHGIRNPLTDIKALNIRPEKKKEYFRMLRHAKNFLKHAKNDPDEILRINPDVNKYSIVEGLLLLEALNDNIPGELFFYRIWFGYHHEQLFESGYTSTLRGLVKTISADMIGNRDMSNFALITEVLDGMRGRRFPFRKQNASAR